MDDEVLVRMDLADTMQEAGFHIYEAGSADEAIRIMEAHPGIGALFTDIAMPGSMDGLKLAHYVRDRWPPTRIVVASGHTECGADVLPRGALFIAKPFRQSDLTRAMQAIGADTGPGGRS
ncbi:response regulator [Allostella humosa]|uniref:response regulator n=1 Tax=Stella humosa TaxID=94 RepID=UPI0018D754A4|nr:response regulator [Stella humosa]